MGGEGGIQPSTGIFYPSIKDVMAADPAFNAVVIEPEHRFYGASLPFGQNGWMNMLYIVIIY